MLSSLSPLRGDHLASMRWPLLLQAAGDCLHLLRGLSWEACLCVRVVSASCHRDVYRALLSLLEPAITSGEWHRRRKSKRGRKKKKKSRIIEASDWCHFCVCVHKRCHSGVFLTLFSFAALWWLFRISKDISIFWRDLWSWFSFVFLYLKTLHADPIKARRLLCWKMRDLMWAKGLQLFKHWARVLAYRF